MKNKDEKLYSLKQGVETPPEKEWDNIATADIDNHHEEMTQQYSTWGDKLLQHTDVLYSIQKEHTFKPITVQLCPCEMCDSDCPFCSVAGRPLKSYMSFSKIEQVLKDFKTLGAKSIEITGGGNPLLYRDKESKKDINDVISVANEMGYNIGIISNSHKLKSIKVENHEKISWIRTSLIKLDEGFEPEDFDFNGFPYEKLGFSYIIYDTGNAPDPLSRTGKTYEGTTIKTIEKMAKLVEIHQEVKFVRIAGNCLIKGNNQAIKNKFKQIINSIDKYGKFFIKDIGEDDSPYNNGCYVGMTRPYIAPHPNGGDYQVYICTSHVLNTRTYDLDYSLGSVNEIIDIWKKANQKYKQEGYPYEIKCNKGKNWEESCKFCYYKFNNKLLYTVANEMKDKDFP
jgi:hypothetical protein